MKAFGEKKKHPRPSIIVEPEKSQLIQHIALGKPSFGGWTPPRRCKRVRGSRLWRQHRHNSPSVRKIGETNFARKKRLAKAEIS